MATLLASSSVKFPEIWPEPPVMGSRITGGGDHLIVEHDGEGLADVLFGDVGEAPRAVSVGVEHGDRDLGAGRKAGAA